MFKVIANPEFTHTVSVRVPVDGGYEDQELKARFKVLSTDEVDAHDFNSGEGMSAFLRDVLVGAEDLADADGQPLRWNDSVRDDLLGKPYVRKALLDAYTQAVAGARAGN